MSYNGLSDFVRLLKEKDDIVVIDEYVNPVFEMTDIADRMIKSGGKALMFRNTGTNYPVLMNIYGSELRICMALSVGSIEEIYEKISRFIEIVMLKGKGGSLYDRFRKFKSLSSIGELLPVRRKGRGRCQEILMKDINLYDFPILYCWPKDGGRFITLPIVNTIDIEKKLPNAGMYRMQVIDNNTTGMHWHLHKTGAYHYNGYKRRGVRMPVTVTLGGDPIYGYVATAPLPKDIDEYILAGFIRGKSVNMVKSITNDIYIPEDSDIVIEGYVDVEEELFYEGPFGDHTGFYSLEDYYPVFHVTCITCRRDAIYPATIVGIPPMEDKYFTMVSSKVFLTIVKSFIIPEVVDWIFPDEGVTHNLVIVKVKCDYKGVGFKVINALWGLGQMMFCKIIITVGENDVINDYRLMLKRLVNSILLGNYIISKGPLDVLDHSTDVVGYGGKMGIDLTICSDVINYNISKSVLNNILVENEDLININTDYIELGLIIMSIDKKKGSIDRLSSWIRNVIDYKILLVFVDKYVNIFDLKTLLWIFLNNFEPVRDFKIIDNTYVMDGCRKTLEIEGFNRRWPDIVLSSKETIQSVDNKWNKLGIGDFIESPSKKFIEKGLFNH